MTPPLNAPENGRYKPRTRSAANVQAHRTDALFRRWRELLSRP